MIDQQSGHQIIGTHFAFWLPQSPARFPPLSLFSFPSFSLSLSLSLRCSPPSSSATFIQPPLGLHFFFIPFLSVGLSLAFPLVCISFSPSQMLLESVETPLNWLSAMIDLL